MRDADPARPPRPASVIINNHNYGRFLAEAIDSALAQTYPQTEVIVVDDGSTDDSRDVIARYAGRVTPVLKANGGQASAFNAGFGVSRGDVVLFLDADDALDRTAVERAVAACAGEVVKVHWPLRIVDEQGRPTGRLMPQKQLPDGDVRAEAMRAGPWAAPTPPTSGIAWSRGFLERVLPVPEQEYPICADAYLFSLAPLAGHLRRIDEPQGIYRVHGSNHYASQRFNAKLARDLSFYERMCRAVTDFLRAQGIDVDPAVWRADAWLRRLERLVCEVEQAVPADGLTIFVDEDQFAAGGQFGPRRVLPFLERDGVYFGPPADDAAATAELERMRRAGCTHIAFTWPCFWWLEHYAGLRRHLEDRFGVVSKTDNVQVFDLRP